MAIGLLNNLIFGAKRIALYLKEKPTITIDDHVLEHMLFYHGLTGSSPQNNKETKIVAADIKEALARKNNAELALALKLPPTLWEERLKGIITSLDETNQELLIRLLFPLDYPGDSMPASDSGHFAIDHEDWQVRANAANIAAFLNAKGTIGALVKSLDNDITGNTMSFCYIAYALGKLQGEQTKVALVKSLANNDTWLRIDAAGALAYFDFDSVSQYLSDVLLNEQDALDYLAYAIARKHKPIKFLQNNSTLTIRAGAQLISGLLEAAQNSFTSQLIEDSESSLCLPRLIELAQRDASPLLVSVAQSLCDWLIAEREQFDKNGSNSLIHDFSLAELQKQKETIANIACDNNFRENILTVLGKVTVDPHAIAPAELAHTIEMAGRLNIDEAQPLLAALLTGANMQIGYGQIKHVITALGQIAANSDSTSCLLINYAEEIFNIEERCALNKSKQPVLEEKTTEAKIYWQILKTLGNLPTEASVKFLFRTLKDYAPDKRACALESLMDNYKNEAKIKLPESVDSILQESLKDPAPMMQLAALDSIARLNRASLIADIIPLIDALENTVSKHALTCLEHLAKNGHAVNVKAALNEKIKTIRAEHKKRRVMDILQNQY